MFCERCGAEQNPVSLRRKAVGRGVKCLLAGASLFVVGYLFATAKLILDGRIPAHDGATRELLLPLGYLGVALLLFVGPGLVLYGVVRMLYALTLEKGRPSQETGNLAA